MGDKQRIFIVEDHTLLRAGLRALLLQDPDLEIIGEADNGRDAVRAIGTMLPNLVLMDISMPGMNGIEATHDIKRRNPGIRILILTVHKSDEYIHESLRAGADGYILKDATHDELQIAIRSVLKGKTYLSPDISDRVIHSYLGGGGKADVGTGRDELTHREREVLKLVAEGHPNKHIADYLCLSIKTVEKHRSNLMKKLDLHNASMLTSYAIEKGLVEI
ncbi:MAG: response regulator transcription factor [Thiobacillus sp.]|nr:response regulator transcription factor [Gammaproteobacteria bacterium]MBU4499596.1 response regulator transcription factor [Gammaproteobacteria bacterium]MDO9009963.1 response regulator transcription factor [Thiobacillus sp.]MDP1923910.1 response regulator transcription factor [Thiobacillus sp.]MDP3124068.1 response regulator transcription factor [Thiobacillus sp.]